MYCSWMHCSLFCLFLNKDFKVTEMPSSLCVFLSFLSSTDFSYIKTTPCVVSVLGSPPTPPDPTDGLPQHLVVPIPSPNVRRATRNHRRREVGEAMDDTQDAIFFPIRFHILLCAIWRPKRCGSDWYLVMGVTSSWGWVSPSSLMSTL
jgi:hypothetical protein